MGLDVTPDRRFLPFQSEFLLGGRIGVWTQMAFLSALNRTLDMQSSLLLQTLSELSGETL